MHTCVLSECEAGRLQMYLCIIFAQGKMFLLFSHTPCNGLSSIYFRAEMLMWFHRGNLGFLWMVAEEAQAVHSPFLIPALFISSLMTVWPLLLAKGVTNPSGHWCRFQPQLQRGEEWKAGPGCRLCCLCLYCLIKSDKGIMVASVHGRPGCWPHGAGLRLRICSLWDSSCADSLITQETSCSQRWARRTYFRWGLPVLEKSVLT